MSFNLTPLYNNTIRFNLFLGAEDCMSLLRVRMYCEQYTALGGGQAKIKPKFKGLSVFFFKALLRVDLNHSHQPYFYHNNNPLAILHSLQVNTKLLTYDIHSLYMVFYNLCLLFWHAGGVDGTFATLVSDQLSHEGVVLDYLTQHHCSRSGLFKTEIQSFKTLDKRTIFSTRFLQRKYQNVDFLFLVDGNIDVRLMATLSKVPTHIVGLTTNVEYAFYFDTLIPVGAASIEIQYFFIECALYSYLSGRREMLKTNILWVNG